VTRKKGKGEKGRFVELRDASDFSERRVRWGAFPTIGRSPKKKRQDFDLGGQKKDQNQKVVNF